MAEKGDNLRVLVVGKTGAGKSATCNTIMGETDFFKEELSASSVTVDFMSAPVHRFNRKIEVYDTPGVLDTGNLSEADTVEVIVKALMATAPGPHVVLYVIRLIDRYSDEQVKSFERLKAFLGEKVTGNMIIAFTFGDQLKSKKTIEKYMESAPETLRNVIEACKSRYVVFNNGDKDLNDAQVLQFLKVADTLGGTVYKDSPYSQAANSAVKAEIEEILNLINKREVEENAHFKKMKQAAEKEIQDKMDAVEKMLAEEKAQTEKKLAEQKVEAEKLVDEKREITLRLLEEKRIATEKHLEEERATHEREMAERKAEQDKRLKEEKAAAEKLRLEDIDKAILATKRDFLGKNKVREVVLGVLLSVAVPVVVGSIQSALAPVTGKLAGKIAGALVASVGSHALLKVQSPASTDCNPVEASDSYSDSQSDSHSYSNSD